MPSSVWFGQALRPLLAAKNLLPPIHLTVLTLTPEKYLKQPSGATLTLVATEFKLLLFLGVFSVLMQFLHPRNL